jgi:hypothetical protein
MAMKYLLDTSALLAAVWESHEAFDALDRWMAGGPTWRTATAPDWPRLTGGLRIRRWNISIEPTA